MSVPYKIDFRVTGTKWQGPSAEILARTAEIGTLVVLQAEPQNPVDAEAVAVFIDGQCVGYVPNRGVRCSTCNQNLTAQDTFCPHCGGGDSVAGGLASRLIHGGILVEGKGTAYVSGYDPDAKDGYLRCTVLLFVS